MVAVACLAVVVKLIWPPMWMAQVVPPTAVAVVGVSSPVQQELQAVAPEVPVVLSAWVLRVVLELAAALMAVTAPEQAAAVEQMAAAAAAATSEVTAAMAFLAMVEKEVAPSLTH